VLHCADSGKAPQKKYRNLAYVTSFMHSESPLTQLSELDSQSMQLSIDVIHTYMFGVRLQNVKSAVCRVVPKVTAVLLHPSITTQAVRPFTISSSPFSHIHH
jgi:hypothetical protein